MLDAVTMLSTLLTLAAVTEATAPGPLPGDRRPADRDAIRAHIEQIFAAYMRRDRAAVRARAGSSAGSSSTCARRSRSWPARAA
jgi:hypothetical protein